MNTESGDLGPRVLTLVTAVAMCVAVYMAFVFAPTEETMGEVQRIFYFHVASAWAGMAAFLGRLHRRHRLPAHSPPEVGHVGAQLGRDRRGVHHHGAGDRLAVGPADLEHLVDLGSAPDDDRDPVGDLRRLLDAARRHR